MRGGHAAILDRRLSGILLHPTSLPGPGPAGNLGVEAYHFIDFLVSAGQRVWQVLPLGPTHDDLSPYQTLSAHAGNPCLISWERVVEAGRLLEDALAQAGAAEPQRGERLLTWALEGFRAHADAAERAAYETFCREEAWWLEDYVLYRALRRALGNRPWFQWPAPLRDRVPADLDEARDVLAETLERLRLGQYLFRVQWLALKRHANSRGIHLFGDLPIFVAHDSADVWAQREFFRLDESGRPTVVAGVPPDYFSAEGQRWGNLLYDWERLQADGFEWWIQRMRTQLVLFDLVRIDHFRGFQAFWEIPAGEETAVNGHWREAPGDALFRALDETLGPLPVVAEDLGTITPEVHALRSDHGLPGMRVLQFAFDGNPANPYLPHNHARDTVVYTGTHDNDTTLGWFGSLDPAFRNRILDYLGQPRDPMPWALIRAALASVSCLSMIPMQDVMGLDSSHRMNVPGVSDGNWQWRFEWSQVPPETAGRLRHLTALYGRLQG